MLSGPESELDVCFFDASQGSQVLHLWHDHPVLRLHGIPSMAMDGPWQFHPWPGLETKCPESSKQLTEAPFFEILSRL